MKEKIRTFIVVRKIATTIIAFALAGVGYYLTVGLRTTATATQYVVENASLGAVVTSVSGSGQVDTVTQVDVKPQTTENVTHVYVGVGDRVAAGQLLIQLDTTNEAKALAQAQISLQSAKLALAKLQEPPTATTLTQSENSVTQAEGQLAAASTTLEKDYQGGFDSVSGSFVDFQTVMSELQSFVIGTNLSKSQANPDVYVNLMPTYLQAQASPYRDAVMSSFQAANTAYQANLADYQAASRYSSPSALDALFGETYDTAKLIGGAVKAVKSLLDFVTTNYPTGSGYAALPSLTATYQTNFGTYTNTANGDIANLADAVNTIASDKTALTNAQLSLTEAEQSLAQLNAGTDPLDIQSQQLSIQQAELSVETAQQNLDADSIRSPIDGIVSAMPSVVGGSVPSPAVSVVGQGKVAEITLNEVDAAKVAVGDNATLTFDAISGLSLAGKVVEIDPVGTVSQGVVNYNVKVSFAEASGQDQVKPGMSVNADIVTAVHQNVVAVPNAAVVTAGSASYVLEPASPLPAAEVAASANGGVELSASPVRVPVVTGISNDTLTEIVSGVNEGDQIIVQTIAGTAGTGAPAVVSSAGAPRAGLGGLGGLGGGGIYRAATGR